MQTRDPASGEAGLTAGMLRCTPLADGRVLLERGRHSVMAFWPLGRGDTVDGDDVTVAMAAGPTIEDDRLVWESTGNRFRRRHILTATDDLLIAWVELEGNGILTDLWLWGEPTRPLWPAFDLWYNPEPNSDRQSFGSGAEAAAVNVTSDKRWRGGDWFFCPAPFCFAFQAEGGGWVAIGLVDPIDRCTFVAFEYAGKPAAFRIRYDGHETVDGWRRSPRLVVVPADSPHAAVRAYADALRRLGCAPTVRRAIPDWWREPIFCGWGEQVNRHRSPRWHDGPVPMSAADLSTEAQYEAYLQLLAENGVVPGTVIVDDRWQRAWGDPTPDPTRWPDLSGFVARRHTAGQRVLLWLKLWDPAGVPPAACIVDPASGQPVAVDPTSPAYADFLRPRLQALIRAGVDGFKLDFHHLTPLGHDLRPAEPVWGAALLHRLCKLIYETAKAARPDVLISSQAANPAFADTLDVVRLNDIASSDQPGSYVASMVDRAQVARAACPGSLIDCDNWPSPNRARCLEYLEAQPAIGIPSLAYASGVCWQDIHGRLVDEPFEPADYRRIAAIWARYRRLHV